MEIIKSINNLNDYYVSNFGNVYSTRQHNGNLNKKMKKIKLTSNKGGYLYANLYKNKYERVYFRVNRLVWEAFNHKIPDDYVINHINHIKTDNNLSNLECITKSENSKKWWEFKKSKCV